MTPTPILLPTDPYLPAPVDLHQAALVALEQAKRTGVAFPHLRVAVHLLRTTDGNLAAAVHTASRWAKSNSPDAASYALVSLLLQECDRAVAP